MSRVTRPTVAVMACALTLTLAVTASAEPLNCRNTPQVEHYGKHHNRQPDGTIVSHLGNHYGKNCPDGHHYHTALIHMHPRPV